MKRMMRMMMRMMMITIWCQQLLNANYILDNNEGQEYGNGVDYKEDHDYDQKGETTPKWKPAPNWKTTPKSKTTQKEETTQKWKATSNSKLSQDGETAAKEKTTQKVKKTTTASTTMKMKTTPEQKTTTITRKMKEGSVKTNAHMKTPTDHHIEEEIREKAKNLETGFTDFLSWLDRLGSVLGYLGEIGDRLRKPFNIGQEEEKHTTQLPDIVTEKDEMTELALDDSRSQQDDSRSQQDDSRSQQEGIQYYSRSQQEGQFRQYVSERKTRKGSLQSENYPGNYPNSFDKIYKINAADTFVITFLDFEFEYHPACTYDWLQIKDGDGSVLLPKTCGDSLPAPVKSKTNKAEIIFHSDNSEARKGFLITWESGPQGPKQCVCGKEGGTNNEDGGSYDYIVGGQDVPPGKYPWVAAVVFDNRPLWSKTYRCGATLIASRWAVTAAHCLYNNNNWPVTSIVLGEHDIRYTDDDKNRKDVPVSDAIPHYLYSSRTKEHDIALLYLAEEVDLNIHTPACLPEAGRIYTGKTGYIYGWGKTGACSNKGQPILQEASLKILSDETCKKSEGVYESLIGGYCRNSTGSYAGRIKENMVCAEGAGADSCQGDSGGPFTVQEGGQHSLVGVVSFAFGCASVNFPGVNTEVANKWIREWIDETIAGFGGAKYCPT